MTDSDPLSAFDARPGQTLSEHVGGVAHNVETLLPTSATTAYGDDWQTVGQALAWTHDAGKLTTWFQEFLETNDRSIAPKEQYTYHGFVSALLTAHVLHALDVSDATRVAGFYAVAKHHGVLPALQNAHEDYRPTGGRVRAEQRCDAAAAQLQNIDSNAATAADEILRRASDGKASWNEIPIENPQYIMDLISKSHSFDEHFYETVLRAWSTLVCADKLDAAGITLSPETPRPELDDIREKVSSFPKGERELDRRLNTLRTKAHEEAYRNLLDASTEGNRLFRITLPTGFGKTLTGLRAALELADSRDGRVIYALPYTSILDQVDDEIQSIFEMDSGDPRYTLHHHLADTWTRLDGETDRVSDGSESLYAETWQSGLVLTTFTQLFESVAGPSNVQSMKLPALQDSVIIIDEPQAISLRWWSLVGRLTRFLAEEYDATLIVMTATQPQILERDETLPTPTPLTAQYDACIDFLEENPRVEFDLHESVVRYLDSDTSAPLALDSAAQTLWRTAQSTQSSNTLAIVNTIESAAVLTEAVGDIEIKRESNTVHLADELLAFYRGRELDSRDDTAKYAAEYLDYLAACIDFDELNVLVATLTTRLRPVDRSLLIEALRRIVDGETTTPFDDCSTLTISTQLIEAGVDISFDRLFRDLAPLPSLVQAAGRCNRSFDGDTATVSVWRLAGPTSEDYIPSELIYGRQSLLRPTRHALNDLRDRHGGQLAHRISEAEMISTGVDTFYERLHSQRRTDARVSELVTDFDTGNGERLRRASLIDESYETRDVAVLASEGDIEHYDEYQTRTDGYIRKETEDAFAALKPLLISVPVPRDDQGYSDEPFDVVEVLGSSEMYQPATGRGLSKELAATDTER